MHIFIEVSVPSQESERSCTCVLGVYIQPLILQFVCFDFRTVDSVIIFVFHFIMYNVRS
jgi:hypothetical protein